MRKVSNNKRRAISTIFNVSILVFFVATLSILLWRLPNRASPAVQIQTAGQDSPIPSMLESGISPVQVEDATPLISEIMTETYVLVAAPELGIVTDEKLSIIRIEPGSAAEQAGLQLGDMLESIQGIPVISAEDRLKAKQMIWSSSAGEQLQLTVIRNGETLDLLFTPLPPPFYPSETQNPEQEPTPTITPVWLPYDYF